MKNSWLAEKTFCSRSIASHRPLYLEKKTERERERERERGERLEKSLYAVAAKIIQKTASIIWDVKI